MCRSLFWPLQQKNKWISLPRRLKSVSQEKKVSAEFGVGGIWQQNLAGTLRSVAPLSMAYCQEGCCWTAVFYSHMGINHFSTLIAESLLALPLEIQETGMVCETWEQAAPQLGHRAPLQTQLWNLILPEGKYVLNYCAITCIMLLWWTDLPSTFLLPIDNYGTNRIGKKEHVRPF